MSAHAGSEKATMSDERTPLIAVVQTRPHRDRYPHHRLRYVCTLFLSISLFTGLIAAVLILNFLPLGDDDSDTAAGISQFVPGKLPEGWPYSRGLDFDGLVGILTETPDSEKAREYSRYYTSGPHLAGKNLSQALWTKDKWEEFGVSSLIVDYDVYLNYPKGHRLALLEKKGDNEKDTAEGEDKWKIKYEASLEEDVLEEDATSGLKDRVPTFHGYSASGNVTAGYVYVNYGTYQDFEDLQTANVTLDGKIALAKYGGVFRGLKVKRAQELGMLGVVMYTDPGDDGEITEANGYAVYPDGPARQPSSVQRGSCQFLSNFSPRTAGRTSCSRSQVSLPATQRPQATPPNLVFPVKTHHTRFPRFHLFPSPTKMPSRCSWLSTATVQKPPRLVGKMVVLNTRA
jgi:N-acetylated-alpha-linked acidic dipeptidase